MVGCIHGRASSWRQVLTRDTTHQMLIGANAAEGIGMDIGIQVLHVDDEPALSELVATYLERERNDLSVTSVPDAETALETLASAERVDCVVTDYDMPGIDGVELLRRIRSANPDLPVILFTGKGSEEVASDAISAGVTEYMQKGASPDQYVVLANRIHNVVSAYRTTNDLHEARDRYRQLVEHAPNAILVVQDGRAVFANQTASAWYERGCLDGLRIERIVDPDALVTFRGTLRAALTAGSATGWEHTRLHEGFAGRHVEYNAATVQYDARDAVQLVFRDVSRRIERARILESLLEATQALIEAHNTRRVYEIVAETALDVLSLPHAAVWRYDPDESALLPVAYPRDDPVLPDDPPVYRAGTSLSWDAFQANETRIYEDLRDLPTFNEDTRIRSEVIVPIGRYGVLNAGATTPRAFSDQAVSLAEVLANTAAAILASRQPRR